MFYGLASGNVDSGGIIVDQVLSDIETLNRAAFDGKYEVTAVSFHAYAHLVDKYALLPHGASMGDSTAHRRRQSKQRHKERQGSRIAIPGTLTTAYLALRITSPILNTSSCRSTRFSRRSSPARRRPASSFTRDS